jgi:TRAP transporter TAXI family solute receptor
MGSNLSEFGHENGTTMADITLGTATPGGGFPLFGEAFAAVIHEMDPSLRVLCRSTRGSAENVPLLEAGELDLALVQGELLRAGTNVRIFAAMYSQAGLFCVPHGSPCRSIGDLAGRRVALGVRTSGLVPFAQRVLDALGVAVDPVYLAQAGDGARLLVAGEVEALWGAGAGWPGFVEVLRSMEARFIAPDAREAAAILASHPSLSRVVLAAGSYEGQAAPIASVGTWSYVLARTSLDEALAYRLARALHRGEAALAARLPAARETTLANTAAVAPDPEQIHPGVARCLAEAGLSQRPSQSPQ